MSRRVDGIRRPEILGPNQAQESIPLAREHEPENGGRCSRPKNEKWGEPVRVGLRHPCPRVVWPALGYASGTPAAQEALQVGKPGQNQEIEQHIDEHRNEGDCKHRDLGETEPPENDFVAERTEPQQFGHPVEELEQDNKEFPKQRQAHGGKEQATRGAR